MIDLYLKTTKLSAPYLTKGAKKSYTILLLTFFSLLFFGVWGIRPLLSNINVLQAELKSARAYQEALTEEISALNQAKEGLAEISNKMEAINKAVPDKPSQAELIEELTVDGGKTGFSFTAIFFKGKETRNRINSESFECTFKGSSAGLTHLLEEIIKGRLVMVESLQYNRERAGTEDTLVVTLKGRSFFYE